MAALVEKRLTLSHVPVTGALGYVETLRELPPTFTATLVPEPQNQYNRHAIAVHAPAGAGKVGYVAPDVAVRLCIGLTARAATGVATTCPARREQGSGTDQAIFLSLDLCGIEELLD